MSIVRIGLAETKNFGEGYEAIFGKKKPEAKQDDNAAKAKTATPKKKKVTKKKK